MKWKDVSLRIKLVISIVLGVFLILSFTSSIVISNVTDQQERLAYDQSIQMTKSYANYFNTDMKSNMAIARSIAISLEANSS